jgi:hypothetical protein
MWIFRHIRAASLAFVFALVLAGCSNHPPCPPDTVEVDADEWMYVKGGLSGPLCMDIYEASVWSSPDCTGIQYGVNGDDYPSNFPDLGNHLPADALYACSLAGVMPSRYVTWFQASQACINQGKRLCEAFTFGYSLCGETPSEPSGPILATGSRSPNTVDIYDLRGNANEWTGTRKGNRFAVIYPNWNCGDYYAEGFEPPTVSSVYSDSILGFRCCQMRYFVGLFQGPFAGPPPDPEFLPSEEGAPLAFTAAVTGGNPTYTVSLSWQDTSNWEEGFALERKTAGTADFAPLATISPDQTAYSESPPCEMSYTYRIYAYAGEKRSEYSQEIQVSTGVCPPTGLNVSVVSISEVKLTWTDNSRSESGYQIERKPVGGNFQVIQTVGGNVTTFQDTVSDFSTTYIYQVTVLDASGKTGGSVGDITVRTAGTILFTITGSPSGGQLPSSPALGSDGTIYWGYAYNPDGTAKTSSLSLSQIKYPPVVGPDGTIYSSSSIGGLSAFDPAGNQKWRYAVSGASTPAVGADGTVYAGFQNSFSAVNAADGTGKWNYSVSGWAGAFPVIDQSRGVYFGYGTSFYALGFTGSLRWQLTQLGGKSLNTTGTGDMSPALAADGTIYLAVESLLVSISPDGVWNWGTSLACGWNSSPVIASDGTILVGGCGVLQAFDAGGSRKWSVSLGGTNSYVSTPAIGSDGNIYAGVQDYGLFAVDAGANILWDVQIDGSPSPPLIVTGGIIYIAFGPTGSNDPIKLYAIISGSMGGLASSPWPRYRHDHQNSGRK